MRLRPTMLGAGEDGVTMPRRWDPNDVGTSLLAGAISCAVLAGSRLP